ncbi:MAG: glycosyltransferase family 1 protein [bacterium]|nr:glycosyltransferase family 1 protein [bacterium]
MIIAIDIRPLLDPFGGVAEYTRMIIESLLALPSEHEYVLFSNSRAIHKPRLNIPASARVQFAFFSIPNRVLNGLIVTIGRPFLDDLIRKKTGVQIDIFFAPNVNFISVSPKVKTVLTVHDLSFVLYKDCLSRKERLWHAAVRPRARMESAAHVIAVSETTKSDLASLYAIPSDRVTVTHLACSSEFSDEKPLPSRSALGLPNRYILSLAGGGRKNCEALIDAYLIVLKDKDVQSPPQLIIAGASENMQKRLEARIARRGIEAHVRIMPVFPFAYRCAYYTYAELFIYPSLYEGFGIPPLEAASCGVPVIASGVGSIPEVMSDAALLVNPYNVASIAQSITVLLTQKELRDTYRARGLKQAQKYSWKKAAEQTLHVFNMIGV